MPVDPDSRRRLADAMEQRRTELGMRWQDVAVKSDVSLKALLNVRTGSAGIRPLTQRGIEEGLQWPPGTIRQILDGGDPPPTPGRDVTVAGPVAAPDGDPLAAASPFPAPSDPAAREEWASFVAAVRDQVEAARSAAAEATDPTITPEPPAEVIFPGDQAAVAIWSRRELPDTERMRAIGTVRWLHAQGLLPGLKPEEVRASPVENGRDKL